MLPNQPLIVQIIYIYVWGTHIPSYIHCITDTNFFRFILFLSFIRNQTKAQENVDACCQRWFYGGKLLGDKMLVEDAQIQPGYIVQVIVNTEHYNHGINS